MEVIPEEIWDKIFETSTDINISQKLHSLDENNEVVNIETHNGEYKVNISWKHMNLLYMLNKGFVLSQIKAKTDIKI